MQDKNLKDNPKMDWTLSTENLLAKLDKPAELKELIECPPYKYAHCCDRIIRSLKLLPDEHKHILLEILLDDISWSKAAFTSVGYIEELVTIFPESRQKIIDTFFVDLAWLKQAVNSTYAIKILLKEFPDYRQTVSESFVGDVNWCKQVINKSYQLIDFLDAYPEHRDLICNYITNDIEWAAVVVKNIHRFSHDIQKILPDYSADFITAILKSKNWMKKNIKNSYDLFYLFKAIPEHIILCMQSLRQHGLLEKVLDDGFKLNEIIEKFPNMQQEIAEIIFQQPVVLEKLLDYRKGKSYPHQYSSYTLNLLAKKFPEFNSQLLEFLMQDTELFKIVFKNTDALIMLYNLFPKQRELIAEQLLSDQKWLVSNLMYGYSFGCKYYGLDNLILELGAKCEEYRARLIELVFDDIDLAKSLLHNPDTFLKLAETLPEQRQLLIEKLLNHYDLFADIISQHISDIDKVIKMFPEKTLEIISVILASEKFNRSHYKTPDYLYEVLYVVPLEIHLTVFEKLLDSGYIRNVFPNNIDSLESFTIKYPLLRGILAKSVLTDQKWLESIILGNSCFYNHDYCCQNFDHLIEIFPEDKLDIYKACLLNKNILEKIVVDIKTLAEILSRVPEHKNKIMVLLLLDSDHAKAIMQQIFNFREPRTLGFFSRPSPVPLENINFDPTEYLQSVISIFKDSIFQKIFTTSNAEELYEAIKQMRQELKVSEVRKNARVLAQANRDGEGLNREPQCFLSVLPSEIGIRIAAMTSDTSTHTQTELEGIAAEHFCKPS